MRAPLASSSSPCEPVFMTIVSFSDLTPAPPGSSCHPTKLGASMATAIRRSSARDSQELVSGLGQPSDHKPRHGGVDQRLTGGAKPLVVLSQAPVVGDPREGALGHPTTRQLLQGRPLRQLAEVHLSPLLEPLPRPDPQDLLRRRLRGAVDHLDLQAERLLAPNPCRARG